MTPEALGTLFGLSPDTVEIALDDTYVVARVIRPGSQEGNRFALRAAPYGIHKNVRVPYGPIDGESLDAVLARHRNETAPPRGVLAALADRVRGDTSHLKPR